MGKEPPSVLHGKDKKYIWHLQQMKDKGEKITMVGTAIFDPFWVALCENAGVDLVRYVSPGVDTTDRMKNMISHTRNIRALAPNICLNAVMQTPEHADKYTAVKVAGLLMSDGVDSVMPMAVTNDTLAYMTQNYIPVFGHVGCLSGWQAALFGGYRRVGKTAEDAMDVFRMAYEYQENGMSGMTIELTSIEVTNAIAKKLRIPVINVAAGGAADGSEMVITDLLGFQPKEFMPAHSKCYREYFADGIKAFAEFKADVDSGAYPAPEHGWNMDEKELDKFLNELEQKY
ncbi:MAG: 3-methyl-2-oxobutanoate hydroxymethyltransferase [Clostridiales Family XIII bacterium]|nr:3-methyl-2-oxobutanoate hydroxymethyltransferase [Clostridiales Family XIII bacterium]